MSASPTPWELFDTVIRDLPPIFWAPQISEGRDGWVVNDGLAIRKLLADTEHFSNKAKFSIRSVAKRAVLPIPSLSDPPDHGFYKALLFPRFAPKYFTALEQEIRTTARTAIDGFRDRGHCEFMADFAFEFPIKVFLMLMGLPLEMTARFLAWEHEMMRGANIQVIADTISSVTEYLAEEIADRRVRPRDDLITFGLQAEHKGRKLNEEELAGYCLNLFLGGLDTVSAAMSHQFVHLATHPEQQARLREDPGLIADAVDELTRAYAVIIQMRDCVKPIEIRGQQILPGDRVCMPTQIANRDPAVFESPAEIIFDRKPQHMTFGTGPHFCLGVHLARRELRTAVEEFLAAIPQFRIAEGHAVAYDLGGIFQPVALPLTWDRLG
ncbi:MAG: cytochrome P450 [Sphingobium sp.]